MSQLGVTLPVSYAPWLWRVSVVSARSAQHDKGATCWTVNSAAQLSVRTDSLGRAAETLTGSAPGDVNTCSELTCGTGSRVQVPPPWAPPSFGEVIAYPHQHADLPPEILPDQPRLNGRRRAGAED